MVQAVSHRTLMFVSLHLAVTALQIAVVVLHITTENDDLPDNNTSIRVQVQISVVALQKYPRCFQSRSCISHDPSRLLFLLIPLPLPFLLFATFAAIPADISITPM